MHGTTGYDFLNAGGRRSSWTPTAPARRSSDVYRRFAGDRRPLRRRRLREQEAGAASGALGRADRARAAGSTASPSSTATRATSRSTACRRRSREVIACFPVYRTLRAGRRRATSAPTTAAHIEAAMRTRQAPQPGDQRARSSTSSRSVLLLETPRAWTRPSVAERREFVLRFQQLTGPVMAKGLEDTAFYRYFPSPRSTRSAAIPRCAGAAVEQFHAENAERRRRRPHGMLGHRDPRHQARRGRAGAARRAVGDPRATGSRRRPLARDEPRRTNGRRRGDVPDGNEEYLLYQTLVGAWPPGAPTRLRPRLRRAHPGLHGQGAAGGQGPHELGQPQRRVRGSRRRLRGRRPRRLSRQPLPRATSWPSSPRVLRPGS